MTEYGFCGLVFFGAMVVMLAAAIVGHIVQVRKNKRDLIVAKKEYRREQAIEYSAEIAALASIYQK